MTSRIAACLAQTTPPQRSSYCAAMARGTGMVVVQTSALSSCRVGLPVFMRGLVRCFNSPCSEYFPKCRSNPKADLYSEVARFCSQDIRAANQVAVCVCAMSWIQAQQFFRAVPPLWKRMPLQGSLAQKAKIIASDMHSQWAVLFRP